MVEEKKSSKKRRLVGVIVSDKMEKTAVVEVERRFPHPKYKKIIKRHKKYKAQNEGNKFKKGDKVIIEESRPLSKTKRWTIVDKA